jgi:hypothetical protein
VRWQERGSDYKSCLSSAGLVACSNILMSRDWDHSEYKSWRAPHMLAVPGFGGLSEGVGSEDQTTSHA